MTFDWHTEYARALETFGGDTPSATLEQDLLDAYTTHPQAVHNAITKIGKAYAAGRIHSPWGALKAEIPKQIKRDITVGEGTEQTRALANAEQWMRNAGLHYDRWSEVQEALAAYPALTPASTNRLHDLWEQTRPTGERLDQDEHDRAKAWIIAHAELATKPRLDPDDHDALRALALSKSTPVPHPPPAGAAT